MSYILDALRKADAQRERDPGRGIHAQPLPPVSGPGAPATGARWGWAAAALLVAAAGGGAWWWAVQGRGAGTAGASTRAAATPGDARIAQGPWAAEVPAAAVQPTAATLDVRAPGAPLTVAQATAGAAASPGTTPGTTPMTPPGAPVAPSTPVPQATAAPAAPVVAPPAATGAAAQGQPGARLPPAGSAPASVPPMPVMPAPAPAPAAPVAQRSPAAPAPAVRSAPPVAAPSPVMAPAAPAAARAPVPAPAAAPTAPLPADAPKVAVSGGVYSADPVQRMLIVNGQVFNEGSEVAPGVRLVEIRPRSAVLEFRGGRYPVAY